MAQITGRRVYGAAQNLHVGPGRLLGYLISHAESTPQLVTFFENNDTSGGVVLHKVWVAPERSPIYIVFGNKDDGIPFNIGLTVQPGNCDVLVWAATYSNTTAGGLKKWDSEAHL